MTEAKKLNLAGATQKAGRRRRNQHSSVDVAKLAGVSQASVSRAFTEGASISSKTKAKVMKAAAELGYRPSILPRILATNNSQLVAIVVGGLYNPYYAGIFELFARKLQASGYQSLVFFVDHNEYFDEVLPLIMKYRVDGIISALSLLSPGAATECAEMEVPVVTLNGRNQIGAISSVCSDNLEGGRRIADLFRHREAKRFAYVSGNESVANTERHRGYLDALEENGIGDVREFCGNFQYAGGCEAARNLLVGDNRPDAVFCANDLMAAGFLETARSEFDVRVPEDLMVAGFDDTAFTEWPSISLTTIQPDTEAMVERSIGFLKRYWGGDDDALGVTEVIPGKLVERNSTARKCLRQANGGFL